MKKLLTSSWRVEGPAGAVGFDRVVCIDEGKSRTPQRFESLIHNTFLAVPQGADGLSDVLTCIFDHVVSLFEQQVTAV